VEDTGVDNGTSSSTKTRKQRLSASSLAEVAKLKEERLARAQELDHERHKTQSEATAALTEHLATIIAEQQKQNQMVMQLLQAQLDLIKK